MQTFLAKCFVLSVVAGGFVFTGDVAWLHHWSLRLLNTNRLSANSTGANSTGAGSAVAQAAPTVGQTSQRHGPQLPVTGAGAWDVPTLSGPAVVQTPNGLDHARLPQPVDGGLRHVDLGQLQPGDRLLVWIGPEAPASHHPVPMQRVVAFDVIDPATGACLEQQHLPAMDQTRTENYAAPRRVVIASSGATSLFGSGFTTAIKPGRIVCGEMIVIQSNPLSTAQTSSSVGIKQLIGPVRALAVQRP